VVTVKMMTDVQMQHNVYIQLFYFFTHHVTALTGWTMDGKSIGSSSNDGR